MSVLVEKARRRGLLIYERTRHRAALAAATLRDLRALRAYIRRVRRADPRRPIVLVSLLERMGDIVACEPVIRHVKGEMPDAFLIWLAKEKHVELLASHPLVDRVQTLYCLTEWIALKRRLRVDRIVDLHVEGQKCLVCNVPLHKEGDTSGITLDNYYHHGGLLSTFSRSAGLPELSDTPVLHLPETAARAVDALALPERYVVFHCSSDEPARNWTREKWRALARLLTDERNVAVVEVGFEPVLGGIESARIVDLCGSLSVMETAEVIRRAAVFVGIDSGPAHLANAVGTYGVVLLGKYRMFDRYTPYSGAYADGTNARILRAEGPASTLPVEEVVAAIRQGLERSATAASLPNVPSSSAP